MSAAIQSQDFIFNQEIAQELARCKVIAEGTHEESTPASTQGGKGASRSGKGGNQTSFDAGTKAPVTAATLLGGIAKTFLAATPQGKFNLLKQLGMPVEEINQSLGVPIDSTEGPASPALGNYFLEIARAMNASSNGNNASITAALQSIAEGKNNLSNVSDQLQNEASTAASTLQKAQNPVHHDWEWKARHFFSDNWKMIVITVAMTIAGALAPYALGALGAAIGPILAGTEVAVEGAADASVMATTAAEGIADTSPEAMSVAQKGVAVAKQAAEYAKQALNFCKQAMIRGSESEMTAAKNVADTAETLAKDARAAVDAVVNDVAASGNVTEPNVTRMTTLEGRLEDLEASVNRLEGVDEASTSTMEKGEKWYNIGAKGARYMRGLRAARLASQGGRVLAGQMAKGAIAGAIIPAVMLGMQENSALNPQIDALLSAQLQVINSNTQVLTNDAQIDNLDISTQQTYVSNYTDRNQTDAQMAQQIIAEMSQVFNVRLN